MLVLFSQDELKKGSRINIYIGLELSNKKIWERKCDPFYMHLLTAKELGVFCGLGSVPYVILKSLHIVVA